MLESVCEFLMAGKIKAIQESSNGHRHKYEIQPPGQPLPREAIGKIPIPIKVQWINGLPIARSSSPIVSVAKSDGVSHYASQFPVDSATLLTSKEQTKIVSSGGRFKSFRLPLRTRSVDTVVWFAVCRSKPSRLLGLLRKCEAIGKKTSYGYGTVSEWSVEPVEADYSWFAESTDGLVLMRPLPLYDDLPDDLLGSRVDYGAVCSPFWQRNLWCERVTPC